MIKTGRPITHGQHSRLMGKTKEYIAWDRMKSRCYNPKNRSYRWYGAKGITVCQEWIDSFVAFFNDVGKAPTKRHSLDRYPDNKGNYIPGNVRWATPEQQQNNRTNNRRCHIGGSWNPNP